MRFRTMVVALAAVLAASACQQGTPSDDEAGAADSMDVAAAASAVAGAATPVDGPATALPPGPGTESNDAAVRALREGRLYAPAGDSAIEYWLQARSRDPGNAAIASAIVELQPYLLIGCEQAIARHDFDEARRLHGLIGASDPAAPALQRLAIAIETAEAESGRAEAVRLAAEEAKRQRAEADARVAEMARAAATQVAAAQATPATAVPAPAAAAPMEAAVVPAATRSSLPSPLPAALAARLPAPVESASLAAPRLLHQPAPRYPSIALGRRMEGAVQVAFTIRPDGSVEGTRVVSADPPGVFDRSALSAVSSYRFEPVGQAVASVVTVRFTLD